MCERDGGCVVAETGVVVVGYAAEKMLLQWILGYACAWGKGSLSSTSLAYSTYFQSCPSIGLLERKILREDDRGRYFDIHLSK